MKKRVNLKQAFSYGAGNFGLNLFFSSVSTYLLYFYTDNLGITAAAAGTLMFAAQLVNLIVNPAMGVLVDRTKSRWGKFRPYFLFGSLPLALIGILVFTVPDLDASGKLAYAYVTYILFNMIYSIVNVPYSSVLADMSHDYQARSQISSIKVFLGQFGGLVVSSATLPLVHMFSTETTGFRLVYIGYGVILIMTLLITFYGTQGVGQTQLDTVKTQASRVTLRKQFNTVFLNKYLFLLLAFIFVFQLCLITKNSAMLYFFKYNMGEANMFAVYSLVGFTIQLAGIVVNPFLVNKIGKRNVGIFSQLIIICSLLGFYLAESNITMVFLLGGLSYIGFGLAIPLLWAMVPDTIEYGEWRTGVRAEGTIYSAFIFVQLFAQAMAAKVSGGILSAVGYVPNAEQTAGALHGIEVIVSVIPVIGAILCAVILAMYTLNESTFQRYVSEINARKTGVAPPH
ncbi:glycoside-pentoside-hexuronide (GPH):cation symporter [Paenibacillus xerothermodurans]|uniref:MFS transporter n=1 Tax=Paenibacillus xerothermodurans TaxID=1977292 RepID=A0A2W1NYX9_PAEXE|nr:glycoside-pentoside-hexuronide (GPH):cation symporter [Paenibacillus xerothermodurans]PZE20058.1 MFS transporter [Paenibacillus xerothermodurans]